MIEDVLAQFDFFLGLVIAIVGAVISVITYVQTQKLAESGSRPLLGIFCGCHSDEVYVRVANSGSGPAIITDAIISDKDGNRISSSLAHYACDKSDVRKYRDWVPVVALKNRPVSTEDNLFLIKFVGDKEEVEKVRDALSHLKISIEYENSFGRQMKPCTCNCEDFFLVASSKTGPYLEKE